MKLTFVRTDKNNTIHVSLRSLEQLVERMKRDNRQGSVGELRRMLPMIIGYGWTFRDKHLLPCICPAAEMVKDEHGDLMFRQWNGLVMLTVGPLNDQKSIAQVKQLAMGMPSTMAAFAGSSGKTVKLLVSVAPASGQQPETEEEADRLYAAAYQYAKGVYGGLLGGRIVEQKATVRAYFRMTLDEQPLLNTKATALRVPSGGILSVPVADAGIKTSQPEAQRHTDYQKYDDYEFLYRSAVEQVKIEMGSRFDDDPNRTEAYATELASRLHRLGFPEEEAVLHMRSHLWTRTEDEHIRAIVGSVYAVPVGEVRETAASRVRRNQQAMMAFLEKKYVFRFNTVMGYTEYRPNNTWVHPYMPVDERILNQMAIECRLEGMDVWDKDVSRYTRSAFIPTYNPIEAYLNDCHGKWDGRDRIRELARTVPTKNRHWEEWFYRWFLGMVRQWQSTVYDRYGNQVAPLLISRQGWNKSTFIQSLLPPELQWGYTNQLDVGEKKQTLQAMSQFLLINLDEFNQISPNLQQGFLKNVITLPSVKVKRPYGKHVEAFPRLASFIGATNQTDVLTDPSGGRRFLGVELTGPINVAHHPNHQQLFAQALAALDSREPYYFTEEETLEILESNRQFQQLTPAEQYFHDYFEAADNEEDGQYMTASAIFARIKKLAGGDLRQNSLNHFGRMLSNIPGIERKRTKSGTKYLVKLRK